MIDINNITLINQETVASQLLSCGPHRFFGTLSFQYLLSEDDAWRLSSALWRKIQRYVLGRRWIKKGITEMKGIVVLEKAFLSPALEKQSCHFHFLLKDHCLLSRDDTEALDVIQEAFRWAASQLTQKDRERNRRKRLVSRHGTRVRLVDDQFRACEYVTKEVWKRGWSWNRVRVLCKDGAI